MIDGKAVHITDAHRTTNSTTQQSLNVGAAVNASGTRAFGDINANSGGPSAAKPMRVDETGPLVFLPDIPLTALTYPDAIASTWDDRILYGLTYYADESEDNLLILDGNGASLGASSSGPNTGRHRSRLGVSGDLFRVVSTHVVPNGMNAPVSYAVSFYNLP
jgi:hypothetical protein